MFYDFFDAMLAEVLNITVDVYIEKIESTTENRREIIILGLMSEDNKKVEKAKRCFYLIK